MLTAEALENLEAQATTKEMLKGSKSRSDLHSGKTTAVSHGSIVPVSMSSVSDVPAINPADYTSSDLISKKVWKGQTTCKNDEHMRKAFIGYILSLSWTCKLTLDIREQVVTRRRPTADNQEITFNEYSVHSIRSGSERKGMGSVAATMMRVTQLKMRDSGDRDRDRRADSVFSNEQMISVLITTLWPLFLESEAYQHACKRSEEPFVYPAQMEEDNGPPQPAREREKVRRLRDIYVNAAKAIYEVELDACLRGGTWAANVLDYLEQLPLSVSVGRLDPNTLQRTVIYVNNAFEASTFYPRNEVLGRVDDFLLCPASDADQLAKVNDAMRKGDGIKIAITHQRNGGSTFPDFLALRPVLHRNTHDCICVIAVHYDVSHDQASVREIKLVNDFLLLMANVLKG